jgi:pilus assembly protein CpaB
LLHNIRVLAIDQSVSEADDETVAIGKTATLEMNLSNAEIFLRAVKEGTVTLALRSMADADPNLIPLSSNRKRSKPGAGSVRVIKYGTESQAGSAGGDEYE